MNVNIEKKMLQCYFCVMCPSFVMGGLIVCNSSQFCSYRLIYGDLYSKSCGSGILMPCNKLVCVCDGDFCNNPVIISEGRNKTTSTENNSEVIISISTIFSSPLPFNHSSNDSEEQTFTSMLNIEQHNLSSSDLLYSPVPWVDIGLTVGILTALVVSGIVVMCLMLRKFK